MIFVDTGGWIAILNRRDQHHEDAIQRLGQWVTIPQGHTSNKTYHSLVYKITGLFRGDLSIFPSRL